MADATKNLKQGQIKTDLITLDYSELRVHGRQVKYVNTSHISVRRTETLLTKEPTTCPWIDTFRDGEVYFDVGANVGLYSIYAGAVRNARVFSFEPEALNYAELNKNIFVNGLHGQITGFCAAVSDEFSISKLHLGGFGVGYSHHDFGDNRWQGDKTIGSRTVKKEERHQQGSIAVSLDQVVKMGAAPAPNHIKIDVDGFEWKVLKGAQETLKNPSLKTVLLEVDYQIRENVALIDDMLAAGWKFSEDQVRINQHEKVPYEKIVSRRERGKGGQNYIFFRDDAYFDYFRNFAETFVPPHPIKR